MSVSTHVLDATTGRPAVGVSVVLRGPRGLELADRQTDVDGRVKDLAGTLAAGIYRLHFDTGAYFGQQTFYPEVSVAFTITEPDGHYHVPLLLSPYAYSTYRGS
ncbi:hydroxyisourate hydrolase [Jatrophihabitans telluris]|uniref:5-hydroxyisourate hydrolase n=1 Tax=Jatrophihabitans telluris TaxID=2038343 RepID=A0ABY4QYK3_9ACTN|nr:hydroxyisourate hydrolase [Jatrophihabitans telluris]UQX88367.1 hydroxyisourate hydrolase [Jatrophihabitans telluris]